MADQIRRYFTSRDMARVSSRACEGCGKCCRGMGDTVHVDPYDCFMLTKESGRPFAALLDCEIALHFEGGLMVPALRMDPDCAFLGADGRCQIHGARPGICRLFPLGRDYKDGKVRYFLLEDACSEKARTKVRIDRWLGIPDISVYEEFKLDWHKFQVSLAGHLSKAAGSETVRCSNLLVLKTFYLTPYRDFYPDFYGRLAHIKHVLNI